MLKNFEINSETIDKACIAIGTLIALTQFLRIFYKKRLFKAEIWPILLSSSGIFFLLPIINKGNANIPVLLCTYFILYVLTVSSGMFSKDFYQIVVSQKKTEKNGKVNFALALFMATVSTAIVFKIFLILADNIKFGKIDIRENLTIIATIFAFSVAITFFLKKIIRAIGINISIAISFLLLLMSVSILTKNSFDIYSIIGYALISISIAIMIPLLLSKIRLEGIYKDSTTNRTILGICILVGQGIASFCFYMLDK